MICLPLFKAMVLGSDRWSLQLEFSQFCCFLVAVCLTQRVFSLALHEFGCFLRISSFDSAMASRWVQFGSLAALLMLECMWSKLGSRISLSKFQILVCSSATHFEPCWTAEQALFISHSNLAHMWGLFSPEWCGSWRVASA